METIHTPALFLKNIKLQRIVSQCGETLTGYWSMIGKGNDL